MKRLVILGLLLASCAGPVKYHTVYSSLADPHYEMRTGLRIGLTPYYGTEHARERGIDELMEKRLLALCQEQLEARGFDVTWIDPRELEEVKNTDGDPVFHYRGKNKIDLLLTTGYFVRQESVTVPYQSWSSHSTYGGGSGSRGSYEVTTWGLIVEVNLWHGPFDIEHSPDSVPSRAWTGTVMQGSPIPNLAERSEEMIEDLFDKEFPEVR